jgi:hypothetical protein
MAAVEAGMISSFVAVFLSPSTRRVTIHGTGTTLGEVHNTLPTHQTYSLRKMLALKIGTSSFC